MYSEFAPDLPQVGGSQAVIRCIKARTSFHLQDFLPIARQRESRATVVALLEGKDVSLRANPDKSGLERQPAIRRLTATNSRCTRQGFRRGICLPAGRGALALSVSFRQLPIYQR